MLIKRAALLSATVLAASTMLVGTANAAFKPKYYAECFAPVKAARDMVPPPPADIAGKAQALGEAANVVSKIPGLGGFGALGGFGGVAKQAATYSNLIADAAQFTQKMQKDYPDAATRVAAYGDKMSEDADKIGGAALQIDGAQTCYADAQTALKTGVDAGQIKGSEASNRQKEIVGGLKEAKSVLDDARITMDTNMKGYNEALTTDTNGMGLNLGTLAQAASMGQGLAGGAGLGAVGGNAGYTPDAVTQARLQGNAMMRNQTNAYSSAWWEAYNRTGGDTAAANAAAQATLNGAASPVTGYQQAYWVAQAQQAAKGTPLAANPMQSLGSLSALSSLSGLSGGGAAFVGGNMAAGMLGNAINGGGAASGAAPQAAAMAAQGANVGQAMGTVNALKGMSGGGAAFVGGNMAVGMLGDAISGKNKQQAAAPQAPATPQANPAIEASLVKASMDSGKFSDAYGLVAWQSQRNAEITATASAN